MSIITKIAELPFINDIKNVGGSVYSVGGAVRDSFLGKTSKDLDIVVRGIPGPDLLTLLRKHGTAKEQLVGGSFAMIKFVQNGGSDEIDIAIPRTERKVAAGYTGFEVNADHNLPIEKDLERRDFTINSIAQDLDGNISDPFGGQQDIRDKVIRVTNPVAFQDDPLRMLRAVQFAARFNFTIEPKTMRMIQDNAPAIKEISGERIMIEFDKIVQKGDPAAATELLWKTRLYKEIFGVEFGGAAPFWMSKVTKMSEFIFMLLIHTTLDPLQVHTKKLKGDLDTSREIKAFKKAAQKVETPLEACWKVFEVGKTAPVLNSFIVREFFNMGPTIVKMKAAGMPFSSKELAINGDDLIAMGIPEGPKHGQILRDVLTLIFDGRLTNERDALVKHIRMMPLNEAVKTIKQRF